MDYPLREYHLRPSSRRSSQRSRNRIAEYNHRNSTEPCHMNGRPLNSGRSTSSSAVRRALQVLDESYRHQNENSQNKNFRSNSDRLAMFRRGRSNSPIKSRTPSPVRKFLRDSNSPTPTPLTPPRILEIERDNLQDALGDSESRRNVLLRKLAETQRTMEIQNDAVRKGETKLRESEAASKLLQQLQEELETKVQYLEKERNSYFNRQLQDAEEKETLRREADSFHHEMKRLQCQIDLMETDKEERQRDMNHFRGEMAKMEESNRKLLENKSVLCDELTSLKQHLSIAKQRIEVLEKEKGRAQDDARNIQESQQAIINRNTELSNRLNVAEDSTVQLRNKLDETDILFGTCKHDLETYKEKCAKQGYKLAELQTTHKDVQSDMDRSLRYITELERTLQSVKEGNQQLKENKITLEDNLTTLHAELAKSRLECSRMSEEKSRYYDELELVKKGQRELTNTLADVRHKLSIKEEDLSHCQEARKTDTRKLGLLETQNRQGERERDELASTLIKLQESHESLKIQTEHNSRTSAQQLQEMKIERDRFEAKYKESEVRSERMGLELAATLEHDHAQLDHWRETCTKLTALIEERDQDQRETTTRLRAAEDITEHLESENKSLQKQVERMQELQLELAELKSENKRLLKECKENQQVISVLEIERDVLAKSPTKSEGKDLLGAEVKKLQSDLKMAVERLSSVEDSKEKFVREDEQEKIRGFEALENDLKRAQGSNKLLTDELSQIKQETATLHNLMEARTDTHEREVRKMEREKERLESRIRSLEEEARLLRSSLTSSAKNPTPSEDVFDLRNLRVEVSRLQRELQEKEQMCLVTKGQLVVAQNARKTAEDRVQSMMAQFQDIEKSTVATRSMDFSMDLKNAQRELETKKAKLEAAEAECTILRSRIQEISEVRVKHENLIKTLRKQLKDFKEKYVKRDVECTKSDDSQRTAVIELASTRRDLQRAFEDIASRDHQLSELRTSLISAQKREQKARQERDELKGKTIIMESITDSNSDLRKDIDKLHKEKFDLEKQLNAYVKSKPCQTPQTSISVDEAIDKEMEGKVVHERNKWLENRISSLLREIDLLRDQNSLLLQEKNEAERQSEAIEGELKSVTISSKSSRQQNELEHIHLQNSNAEKIQQIVELQREAREKNQLIQALSKQLEATQKKTDKKRISSFMKKLRKSSESRSVTSSPERGQVMHASATEPITSTFRSNGELTLLPSTISSQIMTDHGYSTLNASGKSLKERGSNNRNRSRSTPGDISKLFRTTQQSDPDVPRPRWKSNQQLHEIVPQHPETMKGLSPSPTLTTVKRSDQHGDGLMESFPDYISDTGEPLLTPQRQETVDIQPVLEPMRKHAPIVGGHSSATRSRGDDKDSSSEEERSEEEHFRRCLVDTSEQFGKVTERKRGYSSDREIESSRSRNKKNTSGNKEVDDIHDKVDSGTPISPKLQSQRSSDVIPEASVPHPVPIPILPTPASSPSVFSPTSARAIQISISGPENFDDEHFHSGSLQRQKDYSHSPSSNKSASSPELPSPTPTYGTPTKSKSSKTLLADFF